VTAARLVTTSASARASHPPSPHPTSEDERPHDLERQDHPDQGGSNPESTTMSHVPYLALSDTKDARRRDEVPFAAGKEA